MSPAAGAPIRRVLVANRGEIALRVIRTCHRLGIETVLAVSTADRDGVPARTAGRAVCIGPPEAARSYLHVPSLIAAAQGSHCDALHPGYGFLSESASLASACERSGVRFIGPTPAQMRSMGNKLAARELAARRGLPVLPGSAHVTRLADAQAAAARVGFPVMLKAAAGGGGRGMKIVDDAALLPDAFAAASHEARAAFGDDTLFLERYVRNARHVEVQVLGDGRGRVLHLGERDCSVQRRHQKLIEESPAPNLDDALRGRIFEAALALARALDYRSAGTVEFLVDSDAAAFYFLEMNTRIQVEHPVTEMVTGIDLVEQQLRVAAGAGIAMSQDDIGISGHAIECRINAEDPDRGFMPSPGLITRWEAPQGPFIRLDTHCEAGYRVPPYYDSLLGKLIVHGPTREAACVRMRSALAAFRIEGVATTIPLLARVIAEPRFAAGHVSTTLLGSLHPDPAPQAPFTPALRDTGRSPETRTLP